MDKFFAFIEFCLTVVLFACVVVGGAGNIVAGSINGVAGYAFVVVMVALTCKLAVRAWREYKEC